MGRIEAIDITATKDGRKLTVICEEGVLRCGWGGFDGDGTIENYRPTE